MLTYERNLYTVFKKKKIHIFITRLNENAKQIRWMMKNNQKKIILNIKYLDTFRLDNSKKFKKNISFGCPSKEKKIDEMS